MYVESNQMTQNRFFGIDRLPSSQLDFRQDHNEITTLLKVAHLVESSNKKLMLIDCAANISTDINVCVS